MAPKKQKRQAKDSCGHKISDIVIRGRSEMDQVDEVNQIDEYSLSASMKRFFSSSEFTDFTIRTIDEEFKVHKVVICGQSEYFTRMFQGDWKEAAENAADLKEDDTGAVEAMIHFMYGFDYDSSGSGRNRVPPMIFNIRVYQTADKYGVPQLKQQAKEKFEDAVRTCWSMDDFCPAITEAYNVTRPADRGLRDILADTSHNNIQDLLQRDDFLLVLDDCLGFAADILKLQAQSRMTNYKCPNCSYQWAEKRTTVENGTYHCKNCNAGYSTWDKYIVH